MPPRACGGPGVGAPVERAARGGGGGERERESERGGGGGGERARERERGGGGGYTGRCALSATLGAHLSATLAVQGSEQSEIDFEVGPGDCPIPRRARRPSIPGAALPRALRAGSAAAPARHPHGAATAWFSQLPGCSVNCLVVQSTAWLFSQLPGCSVNSAGPGPRCCARAHF